jgi:hypothetical protein
MKTEETMQYSRELAPGARACQAGQVMVEYVLLTAVLAVVMLVPQAFTNNMPVGEYMAHALRAFFRAYTMLVSVF